MTDSRRKGRRFENEVVGYLKAHGYHAERVSEAGLPGPDIQAFGGVFIEAKTRKNDKDITPKMVLKALRDVAMFIFRMNYGPIYVMMELDELMDHDDWVREQQLDQIFNNTGYRVTWEKQL